MRSKTLLGFYPMFTRAWGFLFMASSSNWLGHLPFKEVTWVQAPMMLLGHCRLIGLGHLPFKEKSVGSNPISGTKLWLYRLEARSPDPQSGKVGSTPTTVTKLWQYRPVVKSPDFQSGYEGSIPSTATIT